MVDIMQVVVLLVNIYIATTEQKKRIYIATFLLNFSLLLTYYFNGDIAASLAYIYKDEFKTNIIPYIAIFFQILVGIFTIENLSQIMTILIPCYSTWYLWFYKDTQKLRVGNIIANSAWAIYNFFGGLYIVLIMRLITVLSNLIAFTRQRVISIRKMENSLN